MQCMPWAGKYIAGGVFFSGFRDGLHLASWMLPQAEHRPDMQSAARSTRLHGQNQHGTQVKNKTIKRSIKLTGFCTNAVYARGWKLHCGGGGFSLFRGGLHLASRMLPQAENRPDMQSAARSTRLHGQNQNCTQVKKKEIKSFAFEKTN